MRILKAPRRVTSTPAVTDLLDSHGLRGARVRLVSEDKNKAVLVVPLALERVKTLLEGTMKERFYRLVPEGSQWNLHIVGEHKIFLGFDKIKEFVLREEGQQTKIFIHLYRNIHD